MNRPFLRRVLLLGVHLQIFSQELLDIILSCAFPQPKPSNSGPSKQFMCLIAWIRLHKFGPLLRRFLGDLVLSLGPLGKFSSEPCNPKVLGQGPNMISPKSGQERAQKVDFLHPLLSESREGGVREGGVAQIYRKSCAKFAQNCWYCFVHHTKGAGNCRFCRRLESQLRTILCKYPISNAPFSKLPILTTLENLPFSGPVPEPSDCNPSQQGTEFPSKQCLPLTTQQHVCAGTLPVQNLCDRTGAETHLRSFSAKTFCSSYPLPAY